jgi:hypothetical protein
MLHSRGDVTKWYFSYIYQIVRERQPPEDTRPLKGDGGEGYLTTIDCIQFNTNYLVRSNHEGSVVGDG